MESDKGWPEYPGGPERNHYSPLTQIDTANVQNLKAAWSYAAPDNVQIQMITNL
ncbi:hypothetical protein [Dyadobacter sp. CY312]|uniref:hypothetical protein n=1 Tax=Dyadobacter sp. CY312 TaxID=2907303 RepID=UPI001F35B7BD|nr:hypothetical protein [Dyadobacter sp. CY312]MCE7042815.1 hypothetical protein [Dyadobacter sp. CY312]